LQQLLTAVDSLQSVAEALSKHPHVSCIHNMTFTYRPLQPVERGESEEEDQLDESVGRLVETLEDETDTVAVYTTRG
jgi:transcriptional/translational regulatory protein YebC/TACO1